MKSLSLTLALGAVLFLGACQPASKGDEPAKDTQVIQNNEGQTMKNVAGFYKLSSIGASDRSDLPVPYAMEVSSEGSLAVHVFDMRTQRSSALVLGSLVAVVQNGGEVMIDVGGYTSFLAPQIRVHCGKSTECLKEEQLAVASSLDYETPTWSLSGSTLSFGGLLSGLQGTKVTATTAAKTRDYVQKRSQQIRGLAQRSIEMGPVGALALKKILVQVNGQSVNHPLDSDQTYACNGKTSVVPTFIKSVGLRKDMTIVLNDKVTEALDFLGAGSSQPFTGFAFWNPYRCSDKVCSSVKLSISESQVSLFESVDDCLNIEFVYSNF